MTLRAPRSTSAVEERAADAERQAIVVWQNERIPFVELRDRIAEIPRRVVRDRLLGTYVEALDALEPIYLERLASWMADGPPTPVEGDPAALAVDLEPFSLSSETPYFAALRRYLALVDIEQGDATIGDLWHLLRGSGWSHWFGERETRRAIIATGRTEIAVEGVAGWRAAAEALAGPAEPGESTVAGGVRRAYGLLVGNPEWLVTELRAPQDEVVPFVDFSAFARLARLRQRFAEMVFEMRLYEHPDPGIARAYYHGIVGHHIGVQVPEAAYLHAIPAPWWSLSELRAALFAGDLLEVLEGRFGLAWWRERGATELIESVRAAPTVEDALARLGYDALDWRPVLRQIRTRLIGEMSGYGGPNITTRAGTRKV